MKKAIKIIGKITKWYLILDAIVCAYIGVCRIIHLIMKMERNKIDEGNGHRLRALGLVYRVVSAQNRA